LGRRACVCELPGDGLLFSCDGFLIFPPYDVTLSSSLEDWFPEDGLEATLSLAVDPLKGDGFLLTSDGFGFFPPDDVTLSYLADWFSKDGLNVTLSLTVDPLKGDGFLFSCDGFFVSSSFSTCVGRLNPVLTMNSGDGFFPDLMSFRDLQSNLKSDCLPDGFFLERRVSWVVPLYLLDWSGRVCVSASLREVTGDFGAQTGFSGPGVLSKTSLL
jgi:hypothetical protein